MTGLHILRQESDAFFGMLGAHPSMLALYQAIRRAAAVRAPVVVTGPTGSGKELVARALHALSGSAGGRFCAVNIGALPEQLVESELFGCVRGAYTGAVADRAGLVEAADGGSLFLDEACELPRSVQPKLLRLLEYGEARRVGSTTWKLVRFRLIVAAQEEPSTLRSDGRWRDDLYFRLTGVVLRVPPLRERLSDIPVLSRALVAQAGHAGIEPDAIGVLMRHDWPGNVRELQRVLDRAAFHASEGPIARAHVAAALADGRSVPAPPGQRSLAAARFQHVRETVQACEGDTRRAAELLGISRTHVYRLMKGAPA